MNYTLFSFAYLNDSTLLIFHLKSSHGVMNESQVKCAYGLQDTKAIMTRTFKNPTVDGYYTEWFLIFHPIRDDN